MSTRRRKGKPDVDTKIVSIEAGCRDCYGVEPRWTAANAMAVAARHARKHGHYTWARQSLEVRYGSPDKPFDTPLPGIAVPAAGTDHHPE